MDSFEDSGLKKGILDSIAELGFVTPTPIQKECIPFLLEDGLDLMATAQTGTGKTAGFGLPILQKIDVKRKEVQAIILSPTRELGMQISEDLKNYSKHLKGVQITAVYGGANIQGQIKDLQKGSQIVVGTPGRTLDLINRKKLRLNSVEWLVLDEADEMLSMGFKEELNNILKTVPEQRRTLLFSATMPKEVKSIAKNYMREPHTISVSSDNQTAKNVAHAYYLTKSSNRYLALKRIVDVHPNIYAIVFCRTRRETKEVAEKLANDGYLADALHGDLSQSQRDHVMGRFRKKNLQLLVATDVAARGIDVDDLTHVINYKLPDEDDVYVHRSGRTGRAEKKGTSIVIIQSKERRRIRSIEKRIGKKMEHRNIPRGEEVCEKQLYTLIDKIEKTEVNEEQIAPYMESIEKKLSSMTREELVKRIVSVEFNRFLDYYKGNDDINVGTDDDDGDRDRGRGRGRDSRGRSNMDFARFFLNLGVKDKLSTKDVFNLINENLPQKNVEVGKIEILNTFSFFEIDESFSDILQGNFKDLTFKGRKVQIEIATGRGEGGRGRSTGKRKKKKPSSKDRKRRKEKN